MTTSRLTALGAVLLVLIIGLGMGVASGQDDTIQDDDPPVSGDPVSEDDTAQDDVSEGSDEPAADDDPALSEVSEDAEETATEEEPVMEDPPASSGEPQSEEQSLAETGASSPLLAIVGVGTVLAGVMLFSLSRRLRMQ